MACSCNPYGEPLLQLTRRATAPVARAGGGEEGRRACRGLVQPSAADVHGIRAAGRRLAAQKLAASSADRARVAPQHLLRATRLVKGEPKR